MADQPEITQYDAGIYQLEITDPVEGGVGGISNAPLLSLANRTNWLYTTLNEVIAGEIVPQGLAPIDNPTFTGTASAPTPPLGDNSTKIATTAFVQGTINGTLSLSVAGSANVSLTAVQAGNGILIFTGALAASIAVIVPATSKSWIVENLTTGAFTLTVKTAAGTGIAVSQNKTQELFCDGTNVLLSTSDYVNVALTGTPTAPTAAVGTESAQVANCAFVAAGYAPINNAELTGIPTVPTAAVGTSNTQAASTAFAMTAAANAASGELANALLKSGGVMAGNLETLTQSEASTSPAISGGTLTLNLALSNVFQVALSANVTTLTLENPPAAGIAFGFTVITTANGTPYSFAWPSSVLWPGGTPPTLTSTSGQKDRFVFETTDGGVTYRASTAGQNF
jgi:hypothetical protein